MSPSDENLPSTSKCGECDYKSGDENDLNEHKETLHESKKETFICTYCEFKCDTEIELSKHIQLKHELYECKLCDVHFKQEGKLKSHMCRVPVNNPAHESLYTKGWYDANCCTTVFAVLKTPRLLGFTINDVKKIIPVQLLKIKMLKTMTKLKGWNI